LENRNELKGLKAGPKSRRSCTRVLVMKATFPSFGISPNVSSTLFRGSLDLVREFWKFIVVQLNLPESTITPPIDVPWPPIYFVAEETMMSAP